MYDSMYIKSFLFCTLNVALLYMHCSLHVAIMYMNCTLYDTLQCTSNVRLMYNQPQHLCTYIQCTLNRQCRTTMRTWNVISGDPLLVSVTRNLGMLLTRLGKSSRTKKNKKNGDGGKTKDKQKMDKDKTAVETNARNQKKAKTTHNGVPNEVKDEDDNSFEADAHTEAEAKKLLEAQKILLKASNARPKTGKFSIDMRNEIRQRPENLKAAAKRKKDEEECLRLLEADNGVSGISPTSSRDGQESNDEDTSAS
jgi:hypothetical protein